MERLTKKDKRTKLGVHIPGYPTELDKRIYLKLFNLENLEEELGIDLITLFKALREGIIVVDDNYECHGLSKYKGQEIELNVFLKRLEIKFVGCWNLSDYGKTWSLRKEDLQDEKEN